MSNEIFGFIGCGNMGGALATAVSRIVGGEHILLANRTPEKAAALAGALGARACDNVMAARESDFLFLGVKPFMMADMLADIHDALAGREKPCVLVSMAAGLTMATIREMAGVDCPIIRINPNTPSAVGKGLVMVCADGIDNDDPRMVAFRAAMAGAGLLDDVEERLMDAGSAVAGCGPAFAALMLRHTTTLGVRVQTLRRYTLEREAATVETNYGPVRAKRSHGYGVDRLKPEFDDLAGIARREGIALREIRR